MYDIVFVGEKNKQYVDLKNRFPTMKYSEKVEDIKKKVFTKMFWIVSDDIVIEDTFDFSYKVETYDQKYVHVFLNNNEEYNGVALCPKDRYISKNEVNYRFVLDTKEVPINASNDVIDEYYDVVFISYNESNADENYERLLTFAPHATRVHGVKGIHQAHIEAAKLCNTKMFWIVDGDAVIVDNFNFYQKMEDETTVYVWRSQNPINDLVYGYGGVKLFPRKLALEIDPSTTDMTTSVSKKFKVVSEISNITAFNTDPFSTWRSAFRECVKLSSQVINRQKNEETLQRLTIWTTIGATKPFGKYAILGARAGNIYGSSNIGNSEAIRKINDFNWLREKFDNENI